MRNKYTFCSLFMVAAMGFSACSDDTYDVVGDPENRVYMKTGGWSDDGTLQNVYTLDVLRTPVSATLESGSRKIKLGVRSTKPTATDVKVTLELDKDTVIDGYSVFPSGVNVTLDKNELTIPTSTMASVDSITLSIEDGKWELFVDKTYALAVKLTSVSNAILSEEYDYAYILLKSTYTNLADATSLEGTQIEDRNDWTCTVNSSVSGARLFDGNKRTYPGQFGGTPTYEIDLNKVYNKITGFMLTHYNRWYGASVATVYTSLTGDSYESQGTVSLSAASTQYIRFYQEIDARYIKIVLTPIYSNYGNVMTEFNMYRK